MRKKLKEYYVKMEPRTEKIIQKYLKSDEILLGRYSSFVKINRGDDYEFVENYIIYNSKNKKYTLLSYSDGAELPTRYRKNSSFTDIIELINTRNSKNLSIHPQLGVYDD